MSILTKESISAVIITFNPIWKDLENLILSLNMLLAEVIIVDNASAKEVRALLLVESERIGFRLIQNKENLGIAKALNQGVILARDQGYLWTYTFDQDSKILDDLVYNTLAVYEKIEDKSIIGAIGINAVKSDGEIYYKVPNGSDFKEKDYLITSGSLVSISLFSKIGGFNEDFFIDNVDLEYSLRLKANGFRSYITKAPGMMHDPGDPISKVYFGISFTSSNHNALRRYYMARNHVILCRIYFMNFPYFISKATFFFSLSIIKLLIVELNKKEKIRATLKGLKDGFFYVL